MRVSGRRPVLAWTKPRRARLRLAAAVLGWALYAAVCAWWALGRMAEIGQ